MKIISILEENTQRGGLDHRELYSYREESSSFSTLFVKNRFGMYERREQRRTDRQRGRKRKTYHPSILLSFSFGLGVPRGISQGRKRQPSHRDGVRVASPYFS